MLFSLVSRSNQDEISKSNTALLLAEPIVTDRNSKQHTKKESIWTASIKQNVSVPSFKFKQNSKKKVLENQKNKKYQDRKYSMFI